MSKHVSFPNRLPLRQKNPRSTLHVLEHPSPSALLPSSHSSGSMFLPARGAGSDTAASKQAQAALPSCPSVPNGAVTVAAVLGPGLEHEADAARAVGVAHVCEEDIVDRAATPLCPTQGRQKFLQLHGMVSKHLCLCHAYGLHMCLHTFPYHRCNARGPH
jgi:hypothetical protein